MPQFSHKIFMKKSSFPNFAETWCSGVFWGADFEYRHENFENCPPRDLGRINFDFRKMTNV